MTHICLTVLQLLAQSGSQAQYFEFLVTAHSQSVEVLFDCIAINNVQQSLARPGISLPFYKRMGVRKVQGHSCSKSASVAVPGERPMRLPLRRAPRKRRLFPLKWEGNFSR